ncbi:MAG TPA: methylmalonyl-CoA decarboxylase [Anaeromyxobacteraceae bacterium]|nr:methylmalonyl-CoA decarboxylase [Anaeromyxobacteraceae bacterium]
MPFATNEIRDRIGILTLDDPERRNCLSPEMLDEITAALVRFAEDEVRVVILRARPRAKVWSAGLDVKSLPEPGRDPLDYSDPLEHVIRQVEHFPAPVIAMVEGSVWGGACDLATVCDLAIGSETATFAITPAKLGVPYNCSGILHFLNLIGPRVAREMFFTAEPIRAERALQVGILNHLVPAAELEAFTFGMARRIAENSPLAVGVIKEQLRILARSHPVSPDTFERIQTLRRAVYESADYVEGKRAFLEKRKPVFTGEGTPVMAGAPVPQPVGA